MYIIGLIILSFAIGYRFDQVDGWICFGAGITLLPIFQAIFIRIPRRPL